MQQPASQWPVPTRQSYVRKFALVYCLVTLAFSAYFSPQDFNFKVALIVNVLLFLIGAPHWFRHSKIPPYWLNVISQVANAGASLWICSFLGPTSHINLVAIPQFIMALMMFSGIHPRTTFAAAILCLWQLSLPLFPFVDSWYAHKRMPEDALVILRAILDVTVFGLSTYQFHIISQAWSELLGRAEVEKASAQKQNELRRKLLQVLGHDIKEPVVQSLLAVRSLKKRAAGDDAEIVNQIESAQISIREMISNVEHSNQFAESGAAIPAGLPRESHSVHDVVAKLRPWFESRLREKRITLALEGASAEHRLAATSDSFIYQVFMNLLSNAMKFAPVGGTISIETTRSADGSEVVWSLSDDGEGIREEAFQGEVVSRSGTLGERGSGLGLKIAKLFAEDSGLRLVWLSSHLENKHPEFDSPNRGTRVLLIQTSTARTQS